MVSHHNSDDNDRIEDRGSRSQANTKVQFDGDVQKLLEIRVLGPLVDFPFALRPMTKHVESIGYGWYLLTGSRLLSDGVPKETIRACMILWAANISAAVLASRCEDSTDKTESKDNQLPPVEHFMPTSTGWTYREILKAGGGKVLESAVYGPNGEFQFNKLRLNNAHLCYPSRRRKDTELPIAISLVGISTSRD